MCSLHHWSVFDNKNVPRTFISRTMGFTFHRNYHYWSLHAILQLSWRIYFYLIWEGEAAATVVTYHSQQSLFWIINKKKKFIANFYFFHDFSKVKIDKCTFLLYQQHFATANNSFIIKTSQTKSMKNTMKKQKKMKKTVIAIKKCR